MIPVFEHVYLNFFYLKYTEELIVLVSQYIFNSIFS